MPKSIEITSPALNNDAEYAALIQQLAAFSPAKMLQSSMAVSRQQATEERYLKTQERLADATTQAKGKEIMSFIGDGLAQLMKGDGTIANTYDFIEGDEYNKQINLEKLITHAPELADDPLTKEFVAHQNIKLKQHGSNNKFYNTTFDNTEKGNEGLFQRHLRYKTTLPGGEGQKDTTGEAVIDLNNIEQIIALANNPKEGKEALQSWMEQRNNYAKRKPPNSTKNYIDTYADTFNYADRIFGAIGYNNYRVRNNMPSYMTSETRREDVLQSVVHGKGDLGATFAAEGLEDTRGDIGELTANIESVKSSIAS